MRHALLGIVMLALFGARVSGQERNSVENSASGVPRSSREQAIKDNPSDASAILRYVTEISLDVLNRRAPPSRLDELIEFFDQLPADTPAAKLAIRIGKERATYHRNRALAGTSTLT